MNKLLGSLTLLLVSPAVVAQCDPAGGTSYGSGDEFVANGGTGIPLGFSFNLNGTNYGFIHPNSNGYIYLSDGTPTLTASDWTPTVAEFYANEPRIAPFWMDLNLVAANGGELLVDTSVAGQCTVSWVNAIPYNTTNTPFTVRCTLYATGQIDFVYDSVLTQPTTALVGITPGNGTATAPAAVDISAQAPNSDPMWHELFAANSFDLVDNIVTAVPAPPGWLGVVTPANCATVTLYGAGCNDLPGDCSYELFDAANPLDICSSGTTITFLRAGSGYTVLDSIPGTFVAPTAAATVVSGLDDAYGLVPLSTPMPAPGGTTTSLNVCTNGFVALSNQQPFNGNLYTPTTANFETFTEPTIAGPWYDWSPNQAGQIVYEEVSGVMYITWDAVQPYNGTSNDTFQYQFNLATGDCAIVYDNMSFSGASAWHTPLFGYTSGNVVTGTAVDISTSIQAGLVLTDAVESLALDSTRPQIGGSWDLTTSNIDPVSPIAITFFGPSALTPSLPMTSIGFNAPGCEVHLSSVLGSGSSASVGGSATLSLPVPNNPALSGASLFAQSICLTLQNSANLLTSNGLQGTFGN